MGLIGDVTPGITALSNQLPGVIDKLTTAGHDDIAQLLTGLRADIEQIQSGALMVVKAAEDPLLERFDRLLEILTGFEAFAGGVDISVTPKASAPPK